MDPHIRNSDENYGDAETEQKEPGIKETEVLEEDEVDFDNEEIDNHDSNDVMGDSDCEYGDEPDAEGEDPIAPKPEASYAKANDVQFMTICKGLEAVWKKGEKREKLSDAEKLKRILPPKWLQWLSQSEKPHDPPESIFPVLRLLLPDKDGSRSFLMKEKTLAKMYSGALELSSTSSKYKKLHHFTDPSIVPPGEGTGEFSLVVLHIMKSIKVQTKNGSGLKVGEINKFLDELATLPRRAREAKSNHDWRNLSPSKKARKPPNLNELRADWLKRLNMDSPKRKGLSPLEHKWLVRILLNKLHIGVGWKTLLKWYNPLAAMLWSAHNSLKGICDKLCDPEFSQARDELLLQQTGDKDGELQGLDSYMPKSLVAPQFGIPFSPMLSERTGFGRILNDISRRHRDYISSEDPSSSQNLQLKNSLSFQHPAFSVEPKLDGERLLVHVARSGVVKMHTRRGNWYSELCSPVLAPAIRRALAKWDFDVILDGEVLGFDSGRQETVPFGNNRTIAKLRHKWMEYHGLLDDRDKGMHADDTNVKSMNAANTWNDKNSQANDLAGEQCWLQFCIFDVIYVDGPDAASFLTNVVSPSFSPKPTPGSIINLDAFERKKILYFLIEQQRNEVEIVKTWVVRPNGRIALGQEYFNKDKPILECGYPQLRLDSLNCLLSGSIKDIGRIDNERRKGLSDEQISQARAHALQKIYEITVENQRMEGLVFKDLSTPYYLGEESKSTRYWHKFKPDYFNGSVASDLDVVIIGAYFASGLRFSGKPSSFLCACVDSEDEERFFTLCKVNMGSTDTVTSNNFLENTKFPYGGQKESAEEPSPWFRESQDGNGLPGFLSERSYQSKSIDGSWKYEKKDYPDLWIHPQDSSILTLNAGEIVASDAFSAGITLRFPRINKLRVGADDKPRSEIESDVSLWKIFQDVSENRSSGYDEEIKIGSPIKQDLHIQSRFLTEEQYRTTKKNPAKSRPAREKLGVPVPKVRIAESKALEELTFVVLSGNYAMEKGSCDVAEAEQNGWLIEGKKVKSSDDVKSFILKHGGKCRLNPTAKDCFVLGGRRDDAKVLAHIRTIDRARIKQRTNKLTSKKATSDAEVACMQGVLKWTFVYSVVYKWFSLEDLDGSENVRSSIKKSKGELLQTSVLDFLSRPEAADGKIGEELLNVEISNITMMRRALEIVAQSESPAGRYNNIGISKSWQLQANKLDASERHIVSGHNQSLWPYKEGVHDESTKVIIYPDIFDDFGALNESDNSSDELQLARWKETPGDLQSSKVQAALPLAKVLGAQLSPNLHYGVTHVLCDLVHEKDEVEIKEEPVEVILENHVRNKRLQARLLMMLSNGNHCIKLISPNWVRKRKWMQD